MFSSLARIKISAFIYPVMGTLLFFFCSQVHIPIKPVPITLHTVAMLIIGLCFSKRDAVQSVATYLTLGALGAPVFAGFSGGFIKLFGPSGGFLFGFLVSVWLMITLRERFLLNTPKQLIFVAFAGQVTLYAMGVLWLGVMIGFDSAFKLGLYPFILPGLVKSLLVVGAIRLIKSHR